jgi:uncharacterized membrane protein SpoIIM required for sporulation
VTFRAAGVGAAGLTFGWEVYFFALGIWTEATLTIADP